MSSTGTVGTAHSGSQPTRNARFDTLATGAAFLLLAATTFQWPQFPAAELDPSWRMALGHFFEQGRQFGAEVVFTYGPLGFLLGNTYWGGQFSSLLAWQGVWALAVAVLICGLARRLSPVRRALFVAGFVLLGVADGAILQQLVVLLLGLELTRGGAPGRQRAVLSALGVLALFKFTNLLLALVLVLVAAAGEFGAGRRVRALLLPAGFALACGIVWVTCGQDLLDLPVYLERSWLISQGYHDSMALPPPRGQLVPGLAILSLVGLYVGTSAFRERHDPLPLARALGLGAFVALSWKHGFVRADVYHLVSFYTSALLIVGLHPLRPEPRGRTSRLEHAGLALAAVLSLWSMEQAIPGWVSGSVDRVGQRLARHREALFSGLPLRAPYEQALEVQRRNHDLPRTRAIVGRASLDQLGHTQAVALFNGFNYRPRPVFQGYSAYTPELALLNHAHFVSGRAPEFVLFTLQTIDDRWATLDDALVLRLLPRHYTWVHSEGGYELWRRRPAADRIDESSTLVAGPTRVSLGHWIKVPPVPERGLWVEVEVRLSALGRLRQVLFQPPELALRVRDDQGLETRRRLPRAMGRTGFQLDPPIADTTDYLLAAAGRPTGRVAAFGLEVGLADRAYFDPTVTVTLGRLRPANTAAEFRPDYFHSMAIAPVRFKVAGHPADGVIGGHPVVVMHAPSEMVFSPPAGAREVSGRFGFLPGSYEGRSRTDGADFVVAWRAGGEPVTLFRRHLDPLGTPIDRGLQAFRVTLPGPGGQVHLRVETAGSDSWDWTAWADIAFR